ncbi:MAG: ribose-5-phosphate isomerase RpiA [Hyphomicrobiaceae bacterium]
MSRPTDYKLMAAERALAFVEPGMKVGLGTGSTAAKFVDLLGARVKAGLDVICVPTSDVTQKQAESLGIRLTTLDDEPFLDLVVDGADEIDHRLRLIKGGGGALLREKIVATASDRMIVIADYTKKVEMLGKFPLPVEIVRFGFRASAKMVEMMASDVGCTGDIKLRTIADGKPFVTDGGNYILDLHLQRIAEPDVLAESIRLIPGVVEHGLFLGLADAAIIAGPDGLEVLEANYDE